MSTEIFTRKGRVVGSYWSIPPPDETRENGVNYPITLHPYRLAANLYGETLRIPLWVRLCLLLVGCAVSSWVGGVMLLGVGGLRLLGKYLTPSLFELI